jgi:DNA modification methylase
MPDQSSFNLSTAKTGPVECLGQTFPSEEARREHFLKLLAAKLKEPAFRQIEGFPIGTDEAILALSDPPYYTACPNPWLGDFIKHYGTACDPKKPYHREPFAADVSEGKNHPIYNAHSYHTKVPHRAIMKYILHYTQPGDVVFDGFCGTGMTGLAAQLCADKKEVQGLDYRVLDDGSVLNEEGKPFTKIGARRAILNDLSPAATFISYNYNTPTDPVEFEREASRVLRLLETKFGWMFATLHNASDSEIANAIIALKKCKNAEECAELLSSAESMRKSIPNGGKSNLSLGQINYLVWSDVFNCPECGKELVFWDEAVDAKAGEVRENFPCPHCNSNLTKRRLDKNWINIYDSHLKKTIKQGKQVPVVINYSTSAKGRTERNVNEFDRALVEKISTMDFHNWIPSCELPQGFNTEQPKRSHGFTHVHHFYSHRNLQIIAALKSLLSDSSHKAQLLCLVGDQLPRASKMHKIAVSRLNTTLSKTAGVLAGTLYIPSNQIEYSVIEMIDYRIKDVACQLATTTGITRQLQTTASATALTAADNTLDYIFTDPPFGGNLMYSELNFMWEAWLGVFTANKTEAIENESQGKSLRDYQNLMARCFSEYFRCLKPGRWITIEFSNSQASVWNAIQTSLQQAGFVVASVAGLDKQQRTIKAYTTPTAVKQDLVISAYKPNGGLEERFTRAGTTEAGVWDFIRTHLKNLPIYKAKAGQIEPIVERDPRILYDRMVAFYVGHSTPVPLSSGEFQAELQEQFPVRDGMIFLPEQVNAYDQKRIQMESVGQLAIFVEDERSAIDWVRQFLKERPSTIADITPDFMQQLSASWKKWESRPELRLLLDQNFLCYDGTGEVPSQIHSYLSTQFKDLRNLAKDHAQLRHKAKDRWYVPDPKKNIDVETLRNKRLLEEFWLYLPEGYISAARNPDKSPTLPGMAAATPRPKVPRSKKLREVRTEAIRVGFKYCYQSKDYYTILAVADMLPDSVLNEDEQLQMLYDNAAMRSGASAS